jgi:membrane-bound lytic murein transglycosylase B
MAGNNFQTWVEGLRQEALGLGISASTLDAALAGLEPISGIIELDRRQPEFTRTFSDYLARTVPEERVKTGQRMYHENRALLQEISAKYGVEPHYLVALWAIESDFGRFPGKYSVVGALATLAFDGRRSSFFRKELLEALAIMDQYDLPPEAMTASWAGAMGQVQFMPTTYRNFAVDWDGDGRPDIWNSRADAFASAANYLARSGWKHGGGWGTPVRLPPRFNSALAHLETRKPLKEWRKLGIKDVQGQGDTVASLVLPEGPDGPAFLVYENFRTLLRWNRSVNFALAVAQLSERIGSAEKRK